MIHVVCFAISCLFLIVLKLLCTVNLFLCSDLDIKALNYLSFVLSFCTFNNKLCFFLLQTSYSIILGIMLFKLTRRFTWNILWSLLIYKIYIFVYFFFPLSYFCLHHNDFLPEIFVFFLVVYFAYKAESTLYIHNPPSYPSLIMITNSSYM